MRFVLFDIRAEFLCYGFKSERKQPIKSPYNPKTWNFEKNNDLIWCKIFLYVDFDGFLYWYLQLFISYLIVHLVAYELIRGYNLQLFISNLTIELLTYEFNVFYRISSTI